MNLHSRRQFLRHLGLSAAALPFLPALPSWSAEQKSSAKMQRIIFLFTPNGTVPPDFWPDQTGPDFQLKRILTPLAEFKKQMITLKGVCNKVNGDGDRHMRGMSCSPETFKEAVISQLVGRIIFRSIKKLPNSYKRVRRPQRVLAHSK